MLDDLARDDDVEGTALDQRADVSGDVDVYGVVASLVELFDACLVVVGADALGRDVDNVLVQPLVAAEIEVVRHTAEVERLLVAGVRANDLDPRAVEGRQRPAQLPMPVGQRGSAVRVLAVVLPGHARLQGGRLPGHSTTTR